MKLALVEDEDAIVRPLTAGLAREGFDVERFETAEAALSAFEASIPDVVLMDISLPGLSGIDATRIVKERWDVPVIVLTARTEVQDKILALELGADDYVTKPFGVRELVARIRAQLRRTSWRRRPSAILVGELEVDPTRRRVRVGDRPVSLTAREFDLLAYLAERSPAVVGRTELMRRVWDPHWFGSTATLDVHVGQIRRKIEPDPRHPRYLHTVRGVGYRVRDACAAG